MREVPVTVAVLVVVSGICLQVWGTNGEVPTDSIPTNYLTRSSEGKIKQELIEPGPRAGKTSESPLLSQADQPDPPDATHSRYQRRIARPHRVTLSWQPSANALTNDEVIGYNVYRCSGPSSRCIRINSDPVPTPEYIDDEVRGGHIYYYATTAVNQAGKQSHPSNVVKVVIPFP
jgi:hypothetical protein